jgi:hypothetical protein
MQNKAGKQLWDLIGSLPDRRPAQRGTVRLPYPPSGFLRGIGVALVYHTPVGLSSTNPMPFACHCNPHRELTSDDDTLARNYLLCGVSLQLALDSQIPQDLVSICRIRPGALPPIDKGRQGL